MGTVQGEGDEEEGNKDAGTAGAIWTGPEIASLRAAYEREKGTATMMPRGGWDRNASAVGTRTRIQCMHKAKTLQLGKV